MPETPVKRVLIIGTGFGGLAAAQSLAKENHPALKVTVVTNKPHFEYYPALYRLVAGNSPLEVCIPLNQLLPETELGLTIDQIDLLDPVAKRAYGASGSHYHFDYAVVAVGAQTTYFKVPGLEQFSYGFKSINEAITLHDHLHQMFVEAQRAAPNPEEQLRLLHVVVVGGGASGVELSGELAVTMRQMAKNHRIDPGLVTIDLVEGAPRLLPAMPEQVSQRALERLRRLGVNVLLNRPIMREEATEVTIRGMQIKTATVIWTSGVTPSSLYQKIPGLQYDKRGRVLVNEFLEAEGAPGVFVVGDGSATKYWGMAQTAVDQARLVAYNLVGIAKKRSWRRYQPKEPYYSIPVGPGWALTLIGKRLVTGRLGWWLRRLADARFFFTVLPPGKALTAWRARGRLSHQCSLCEDILLANKNQNAK
jgi:NADH dehydrogenase